MNLRPMILASVAIIVAMFLVSIVAWIQLPADAQVPIHWGANGEPDSWADKTVGLFLLPVVAVGVTGLFILIPRVEPRRANLERSGKAFGAVWIGVMLLFGAIHLLAVGFAFGADFDMTRVVMIGTGVLFIAIGNYLPKVQPNYMVGVRTPWTLASDRSWRRTHRLAGRLFVLAGVLIAALGLLGIGGSALVVALIATITVILGITFAYSYQEWKADPEKRT